MRKIFVHSIRNVKEVIVVKGGVLERAAYFANDCPEVWRSLEGCVYQKAEFIRGNAVRSSVSVTSLYEV